MTSLTEITNLLEWAIDHEYFEDDWDPALDYSYMFGLGWSLKQSQNLLKLLEAVPEVLIDT
jgi:hypothetical protein